MIPLVQDSFIAPKNLKCRKNRAFLCGHLKTKTRDPITGPRENTQQTI